MHSWQDQVIEWVFDAATNAIDPYLTRHLGILQAVDTSPAPPLSPDEIFVTCPPLAPAEERIPARLQRLLRKFDPVERDHRNRLLGRAGEKFVIDLERRRLAGSDRSDLARKVRWIAAEQGDGAGYDVLSFDPTGRERLLEVKTTNGSARTPFFLTRNERTVAAERPADWRIYRVHFFSSEPRVFTIIPPLEEKINLRPETWRASFFT